MEKKEKEKTKKIAFSQPPPTDKPKGSSLYGDTELGKVYFHPFRKSTNSLMVVSMRSFLLSSCLSLCSRMTCDRFLHRPKPTSTSQL